MSEFDKWWEENCMTLSADRTEAEDIYNLGVESQQAKTDELQKKYDAMYNAFVVADDCRKEWHESCMSARRGRDELQASVNVAIDELEIDLQSPDYDDLRYRVGDTVDILKGNKDEN